MTDKQFKSWLKHQLRRISRFWKPISQCKTNARVERGKYLCNICKGIFKSKEVEVDHIKPVAESNGDDWNEYINALFCPVGNLQCVCKSCHKIKSKEDYNKRL